MSLEPQTATEALSAESAAPILRTPAEWSAEEGVTVMDPDGWRGSRTLPAKSWDEPISREEWQKRLEVSTHSLLTAKPERVDLPRDWRAVHVPPGTKFFDEPSETVPPGWYVYGGKPRLEEDEGVPFALLVEASGPDFDHETTAKAVAARLNGGQA